MSNNDCLLSAGVVKCFVVGKITQVDHCLHDVHCSVKFLALIDQFNDWTLGWGFLLYSCVSFCLKFSLSAERKRQKYRTK